MSMETTLARIEARKAEEDWADHKLGCAPCANALRRRQPGWMCAGGAGLYRAERTAAAELARQRELDKQPTPGQGALFP
jgi:hypothetical protein